VKFSIDGSEVALGAGARSPDGTVHVEAIRSAPLSEGTQWLVDYLVQRKDRTAQIVIDGKSGAGYLIEALRAEGIGKQIIIPPAVDQVITGHTMFDQALTEGTLTHASQDVLDKQIGDTTRRKIGAHGGFGWAPISSTGSVSFVDAVTLAFWGARTTKRNPGRKQRFR
jgi:hypothetical protein